MTTAIDIIIPTYITVDLTIRCIEHIKEKTKIPYRLIHINDGYNMKKFHEIIDRSRSLDLSFLHYSFEENKGFASAINKGIEMSDSAYLVMINNDVIVTEGWLGKLIYGLESSKKVALVSAITNNISSGCRYDRVAKALGIDPPKDPENYFNALSFKLHSLKSNVSFFCAAIKAEVINKIGGLDERFYCGAEDDDYNDRIRRAGYETAICINCFVYHDHHATVSLVPEWQKRRKENGVLLRRKRAERAKGNE